jgi:hypothetical protein
MVIIRFANGKIENSGVSFGGRAACCWPWALKEAGAL